MITLRTLEMYQRNLLSNFNDVHIRQTISDSLLLMLPEIIEALQGKAVTFDKLDPDVAKNARFSRESFVSKPRQYTRDTAETFESSLKEGQTVFIDGVKHVLGKAYDAPLDPITLKDEYDD